MVIVRFDEDFDHGAFDPRVTDELFNFVFATAEGTLLARLGEDGEAFEVAEAIVGDCDDFADEAPAAVVRIRRAGFRRFVAVSGFGEFVAGNLA